jgi:N-acetylglucosamine-6-sulfatase
MMRKPYKYLLWFALLNLIVGLGMTGAQAHSSLAQTASRPNIIFLFTDDQDPGSLSVMPNVQNLLVNKGKTFPNATFTQPLCCPSRASMLTGQYPHNTGILDDGGVDGGEGTFRRLGRDRSTYATWLQAAGYKTGYFGKYMNGYEDETYVPPGWARWVAADHAPATMRISNNGKLVRLGDRYETFDLAMKDYSLNFLKNNVGSQQPFFMAVSFSSPHTEFGTAKYEQRYADRFSSARWPRTPNFNEQDRSDKPLWVRKLPAVTQDKAKEIDQKYRARLRSLLTVDDTVGNYVSALVGAGELSNTYIFYFTDNGWHMGNHALPMGKNTPYTEDVESPLIVWGPQIAPNTKDNRLVSNIDVAPTFAEIANTSPTSSVDGRSILPLLRGQEVPWRTALLVEGQGSQVPIYKAVRTNSFAYHYYPGTEEEELYDLIADPYQLQSRHDDPAYTETKATLRSRLEMLKDCAGVTCKAADGGG